MGPNNTIRGYPIFPSSDIPEKSALRISNPFPYLVSVHFINNLFGVSSFTHSHSTNDATYYHFIVSRSFGNCFANRPQRSRWVWLWLKVVTLITLGLTSSCLTVVSHFSWSVCPRPFWVSELMVLQGPFNFRGRELLMDIRDGDMTEPKNVNTG